MGKEIEALITYNEVAIINRIILYWKCKQKKHGCQVMLGILGMILRIYIAIGEHTVTKHKAIIC